MTTETTTNPTGAEGETETNGSATEIAEEVVEGQDGEAANAEGEGGEPAGQPNADDDTDEVEHEGQKYRIPKAVKPLVMMNADYTRKTQDLAEQRKALGGEQEQFRQHAKLYHETLADQARLINIDDQLNQYQQVNWAALSDQDPVKAQRLQGQFLTLQQQRQALVGQIQEKQQKLSSDAQQRAAKRAEESQAFLQREIPGWSSELDVKLSKFAIDQGFTAEQIRGLAVSSPVAVKVLHLAYLGKQLMDKQRTAAKPKPPSANPVPQVNASRGSATKDPDRMSTKEWMDWRSKSLAKKAG